MTRRLTVLFILCTHFSAVAYSADRGSSAVDGLAAIEYGRPELGGRDMLGRAKEGMVWRLGMNRSTTLTAHVALMLAGNKVDKGVYSLLAECTGADSWRLIVNSEPEVRGSNRDPKQDVVVAPLQTSELSQSVEKLTISLESTGEKSGKISIEWGKRKLATAFTTAD